LIIALAILALFAVLMWASQVRTLLKQLREARDRNERRVVWISAVVAWGITLVFWVIGWKYVVANLK